MSDVRKSRSNFSHIYGAAKSTQLFKHNSLSFQSRLLSPIKHRTRPVNMVLPDSLSWVGPAGEQRERERPRPTTAPPRSLITHSVVLAGAAAAACFCCLAPALQVMADLMPPARSWASSSACINGVTHIQISQMLLASSASASA
jgi:hypothetical protein